MLDFQADTCNILFYRFTLTGVPSNEELQETPYPCIKVLSLRDQAFKTIQSLLATIADIEHHFIFENI
jgi:hypothetical protein